MRRIVSVIIFCLIVFLVGRAVLLTLRFHEVERNFERVSSGMPSSDVLKILGNPTYHKGNCLTDLKMSNGCSKEFVYGPFLAPLVADYYVVDFSSNDRVISTAHLVSP